MRNAVLFLLLLCEGISAQSSENWFAFSPKLDPFTQNSAIDLRSLNEPIAGDGGFIAVRDGQFIHSSTGKPVRFWAVNVSPDMKPAMLKQTARILAKHGVNLVRIHGGYFKQDGSIDLNRIQHTLAIIQAMKAQGIYSHLSTYYPIWLTPKPGTPWLEGYDGKKHPFAALYFNPEFQQKYQSWWRALLTTPDPQTGKKLINEPAVFGAEIINEDSYFFWTFDAKNIPEPELQILEKQFGTWLTKKYGSLASTLAHWHNQRSARDNPAEGRMAFRPLWNMFNERSQRDKDTATFLTESQRDFYHETYQFLRALGFKGVITASNWATASPQYFGPLEKYTYTTCDFLDRHGYFGCNDHGPNDGWAIMNNQTYCDRSALRFDPEQPSKPKEFVNPVMDVHYDGKPSMISETTFNRPNRYRTEAALYYACYGALQDSNCIVHFALDGSDWSDKPGYFMQPWTLMSPTMMGQFPAAALIYRQSLISLGDELAHIELNISDIENLKGTPLPQDAAFDEMRAKDIPQGTTVRPGNIIDPLIHYAGRTSVYFTKQQGSVHLKNLQGLIDRAHQTVTSSNGQLKLDYGKGFLSINAPAAQGIVGNLHAAGAAGLKDLSISSNMDLGAIVAVTLDEKPLATSSRILLQVMSEEQNTGWQTEYVNAATKKILNIGRDPWMVKRVSGGVKFKSPDARELKITELDLNGYPTNHSQTGPQLTFAPDVVYYLISR